VRFKIMICSKSLPFKHADPFRSDGARRNHYKLSAFLVFLFAANIYDVGGVIGVKYLSFGLAALYGISQISKVQLTRVELLTGLVVFLVWPMATLFHGVLGTVNTRLAISEVTSFPAMFVMGVLASAASERLPLRLFYWCMFSLALVTVVLFSLEYLVPQNTISGPLVDYFSDHGQLFGFFGVKPDWDGQVPNIYFGATLFLVPTFVYFLCTGRMCVATVVFVAIGLAFSKAGVLFCVGFACIWPILYSANSRKRGKDSAMPGRNQRGFWARSRAAVSLAVMPCLMALLFWWFPSFMQDIYEALAGQSQTTTIRLNQARDFVSLVDAHPQYLLFGQGAGVPAAELDHVNTIRKFGLPWFILFTGIAIYSSWGLWKRGDIEMKAFGLALLSIYVIAGTNPVLTSPLFLMLLTISYFAQRQVHVGTS